MLPLMGTASTEFDPVASPDGGKAWVGKSDYGRRAVERESSTAGHQSARLHSEVLLRISHCDKTIAKRAIGCLHNGCEHPSLRRKVSDARGDHRLDGAPPAAWPLPPRPPQQSAAHGACR